MIVDRYLLAHVHNYHKHLAQVVSLRYGFGASCGRCCVVSDLGLANMALWISLGCREYVEIWHCFLVCFYLIIVKNSLIVCCVLYLFVRFLFLFSFKFLVWIYVLCQYVWRRFTHIQYFNCLNFVLFPINNKYYLL